MTKLERDALRNAFADYRRAAGCGYCGDLERREDAEKRLAALLRVPQYSDASGFNFSRYATSRGES